jgi:glycosyltransferase involved in cell wall biosynthesis
MSQQLRLALISAFPPGRQSLNEYGYHLARHLAKHDDVKEVVVLADQLETPQEEIELDPKVSVERIWTFNGLTTLPRLVRRLRQIRPDGAIFNLHTTSFGDREITAALGLLTPMTARLGGVPTGVIAHNIIAGVELENTLLKGRPLRQAVVRAGGAAITSALVRASYLTVTLSSYHKHLTDAYPRRDISHIPHGTFDTDQPAPAPLESRPKRIVTMGKFGTYKRLETLIDAFKSLKKTPEMADYELVIGGTDHPNAKGYMAETENACREVPEIHFHGYVAEEDIARFFSTAQLSVFDYESTTGSSGVLHQTASYGAVPVFPKIGDFVDVCRDEGLEGFNYTPRSASSMASAMRDALSDLEQASRLADANYRASKGFPFDQVVGFHIDKIGQRTSSMKGGRV